MPQPPFLALSIPLNLVPFEISPLLHHLSSQPPPPAPPLPPSPGVDASLNTGCISRTVTAELIDTRPGFFCLVARQRRRTDSQSRLGSDLTELS